MNTAHTNTLDWRKDLEASRDVNPRDKRGFAMVLDWMEKWRMRQRLDPGRNSACAFWKAQVVAKQRPQWQLDQWAEAIRWYLNWLQFCHDQGKPGMSVEERVRLAVDRAGGRRGLKRRTRQSYSRWAGRYACWIGDARAAMDPANARDWLGQLVTVQRLSFSSQKGALCALAFFFKDVCGMEEVDLGVRLRKTAPRAPVVLNLSEISALLDHLPERCRLAAELQYGAGLRLSELMELRIKDIDLERRQVTVRAGKGDRDRVTVLPKEVAEKLVERKKELRKLHERDRAANVPRVALPGALARKYPKAGEEWNWFWLFIALSRALRFDFVTLRALSRRGSPSHKLSEDPDSGIRRRHHLHPFSYSRAIRKAAKAAGIEKRVISHALRHSFDSAAPPAASPSGLRSAPSKTPPALGVFATHLLEAGADIRTIDSAAPPAASPSGLRFAPSSMPPSLGIDQELLGHSDVSTTMKYTHVAKNTSHAGVQSPLDGVREGLVPHLPKPDKMAA